MTIIIVSHYYHDNYDIGIPLLIKKKYSNIVRTRSPAITINYRKHVHTPSSQQTISEKYNTHPVVRTTPSQHPHRHRGSKKTGLLRGTRNRNHHRNIARARAQQMYGADHSSSSDVARTHIHTRAGN